MHWIQTIRENLGLTQSEIAHYLQLSIHTIQSIELNRRNLPLNTLMPAMALYKAVADVHANGPVSSISLDETSRKHQQNQLYNKRLRQLGKVTDELQKAQRTYQSACIQLGVYQQLIQALAPANSEENRARLQWTQDRVKETIQRIKDNNLTLQDQLAAEIAGLQGMTKALERMLM